MSTADRTAARSSSTTTANASELWLLANERPLELEQTLAGLTNDQARDLFYDWSFLARPNQLPPSGNWFIWLILAGRGFGKTRSGAEFVKARVESGRFHRIGLIAETAADARDVMVEGEESGLLAIYPPEKRPLYEPSKRRLTWPNGAIATTYSGDDPEQMRGPQHDTVWCDEPAKWRYLAESWVNMEMGLRIGPKPQACATTTPRPIRFLRDLIADPQVVVTRGSTFDNRPNLSPAFIERVVKRHEGTRLGRQELYAELLEDAEGALWHREPMIERHRVNAAPDLVQVVVGVDPPGSSGPQAADCGIIVAGRGPDGHGYVLADLTIHGTPNVWASAVVAAYSTYRANRVVAEINFGGEMVEHTLRSVAGGSALPITVVRASRGKHVRAEPVSAMYEQGKGHHVGPLPELEDELCTWSPGEGQPSPNRLDALVWAFWELFKFDQQMVTPGVFDLVGVKGWSPR